MMLRLKYLVVGAEEMIKNHYQFLIQIMKKLNIDYLMNLT